MKRIFYLIDVNYNQEYFLKNDTIVTGSEDDFSCAKSLLMDNDIKNAFFSPKAKFEKVSDEEYKDIVSRVFDKILMNNPDLKSKYVFNKEKTTSRFAFPVSSLKKWSDFKWINKKTKTCLNIDDSSLFDGLRTMYHLEGDKDDIFDSILFAETNYFMNECDGSSWTASPLPVPSFLWMIYDSRKEYRTTNSYIVIPEIYKIEGEEYDKDTLSVETGASYLRDWVEGQLLDFIEDDNNILYAIKRGGVFCDLIKKYDKYAQRGINLSKLPDYEEIKKFERNLIVSEDKTVTPIVDYLLHTDVMLYPICGITELAKKLKQPIKEYCIPNPAWKTWDM